jgi:hypothetical protein
MARCTASTTARAPTDGHPTVEVARVEAQSPEDLTSHRVSAVIRVRAAGGTDKMSCSARGRRCRGARAVRWRSRREAPSAPRSRTSRSHARPARLRPLPPDRVAPTRSWVRPVSSRRSSRPSRGRPLCRLRSTTYLEDDSPHCPGPRAPRFRSRLPACPPAAGLSTPPVAELAAGRYVVLHHPSPDDSIPRALCREHVSRGRNWTGCRRRTTSPCCGRRSWLGANAASTS